MPINNLISQLSSQLSNISTVSILNLIYLLIIFTLLYMNPYKPKIRDMYNWWKLKLYKNPSIHRIIFPNGNEAEYVLSNFDDKLEASYDKTKRTYIMNQQKITRRNKVPIYTHHLEKTTGVDFFSSTEAQKLDSEKFNSIIHNAKVNVDVLKELFKRKDMLKYLTIAAIGMGAAALFSFQGLNVANTILQHITTIMGHIDKGDIVVKCANVAEIVTK